MTKQDFKIENLFTVKNVIRVFSGAFAVAVSLIGNSIAHSYNDFQNDFKEIKKELAEIKEYQAAGKERGAKKDFRLDKIEGKEVIYDEKISDFDWRIAVIEAKVHIK